MANLLDKAKGQFSAIQGTVTETYNNVKTGKLHFFTYIYVT